MPPRRNSPEAASGELVVAARITAGTAGNPVNPYFRNLLREQGVMATYFIFNTVLQTKAAGKPRTAALDLGQKGIFK
jgi:hypothetical protein